MQEDLGPTSVPATIGQLQETGATLVRCRPTHTLSCCHAQRWATQTSISNCVVITQAWASYEGGLHTPGS